MNQARILLATLACLFLLAIQPIVRAGPREDKPVHIVDNFDQPHLEERTLSRGDWVVASGMASVKFNPVYFKNFKDHGALLSYQTPLDDVELTMRFTPHNYDLVIFTFDAADGGHVFRIRFEAERPSLAITFMHDHERNRARSVVLNRDLPRLKDGEENELSVLSRGKDIHFSINGREFVASNGLLARPKGVTKLGIQHGDLDVSFVEIKER